ncbi:unnamed protein product [Rhizoctonia solani]|uniref:Protein kinase domain-containing protein n=1 Tax=Rhizoctonia solani TaxID=456999 RepID=A0A8H2XUY1_9AGAM|nr:unnamed protein product [Rhizoctonia solani]
MLNFIHEDHTGPVQSVAFSPDGKWIASGSTDNTIRIRDMLALSLIGKPMMNHATGVNSISYSPLGDKLVSGSPDRTVRIWDTNTGRQLCEPLRGHASVVSSVSFSPGGSLVASGSFDSTIRLWDTRSRRSASGPLTGHFEAIRAVKFCSNGAHIVSCSADQTLRIWDVERRMHAIGPLKGHTNEVISVDYSPDNSQTVSGSWDTSLRFWDARSGDAISEPYQGHTDYVISVAFSPNGIYVASGGKDRTVRVWDVRSRRQILDPFQGHTNTVTSVSFSPCGRYIASGSADKTVVIWSLSDRDSDMESSSYSPVQRNNPRFEVEGDMQPIGQNTLIQEMFNLLLAHGCADLSLKINSNQAAIDLPAKGGHGSAWRRELIGGTKVLIQVWRESVIERCDHETLKVTSAVQEIQAWSLMKHKNIHQFMGVIAPEGHYLGLIWEWTEYDDLYEYMRKNFNFDRHRMVAGLAYMHQCNVTHGGLKALNVLVTSDGVAKLSNFGLVHTSDAHVALSETVSSHTESVRWMAPELLSEGASKTKKSDIYALGMTMLVRGIFHI